MSLSVLPWVIAIDDEVRSTNEQPFVTTWPMSPAPLWWALGAEGQRRPGLPKEVSGWLFISRCFCGDEAWLSYKCSNLCHREGAATGTGAGKRGQVAICHSLSLQLSKWASTRVPWSLGAMDPAPTEQGAHSDYRPGSLTFQNGTAEKWTSGKNILFLGRATLY